MGRHGGHAQYLRPGANMPSEIRAFAEKMAASQGCKVSVTRERSGYHLYMPCPECLADHGRKELADPKYTINLSKHLGIGSDDDLMFQDWNEIENTRDNRAGICMRTRSSSKPHMFKVSELLAMQTITERHPEIHTCASIASTVDSADRESHWEMDPETGILCPPPPSESPSDLIPVHELDPDHVGRQYLESRGFDMQRMWDMFRASWCEKEYPYGQNKIYYRKMPGGWKDTPQGRIIFHALKDGVPKTWQGRVIEKLSDDGTEHYYWHPYKDRWDLVETRSHNKAPWMRQEPFDAINEEHTYEWKPSKYKTAKYSERFFAGWDAAIAANLDREHPWCVIVEGPLDAARVGPGGLAVMGSSLSPECAALIVQNFKVVITAFDNDAAGNAATTFCRSLPGADWQSWGHHCPRSDAIRHAGATLRGWRRADGATRPKLLPAASGRSWCAHSDEQAPTRHRFHIRGRGANAKFRLARPLKYDTCVVFAGFIPSRSWEPHTIRSRPPPGYWLGSAMAGRRQQQPVGRSVHRPEVSALPNECHRRPDGTAWPQGRV